MPTSKDPDPVAARQLLTELHDAMSTFDRRLQDAHESFVFGDECVLDEDGDCLVCEITSAVEGLRMDLDLHLDDTQADEIG